MDCGKDSECQIRKTPVLIFLSKAILPFDTCPQNSNPVVQFILSKKATKI